MPLWKSALWAMLIWAATASAAISQQFTRDELNWLVERAHDLCDAVKEARGKKSGTQLEAGAEANPLNKFTVSPRDNLKPNADGSVTLYFQNESPGADKETNWLPAPKGEFIPMMRMYYPAETSPSIIDGSWKIPPVVKAS